MSKLSNNEIIESVLKNIPNPHLIKNIDLSFDDSIRFDWIGRRYKVSYDLYVEVVEDGVLTRENDAKFLQHLLMGN